MNWDDRYSEPGFAYGTAPNEFLALVADRSGFGGTAAGSEVMTYKEEFYEQNPEEHLRRQFLDPLYGERNN